jgi:hypothetical protein
VLKLAYNLRSLGLLENQALKLLRARMLPLELKWARKMNQTPVNHIPTKSSAANDKVTRAA